MTTRRRFSDRYPLRITIVVALLVLVTAALVGSGFTATAIMRGYLLDRIDDGLGSAAKDLSMAPIPGPSPRRQGPPTPYYTQYLTIDGTVALTLMRRPEGPQGAPQLPSFTIDEARSHGREPFNVTSTTGEGSWRAVVIPRPDGRATVIVAQDLADMNATINQLVGVQMAVGVILLVLLAGVGTYVVRRSLRGLEDVEHTAVAIAGGDLSRRVPERDPRTEVGRLSLALNQMLGQIENAFAMRTASEYAARRSEDTARKSEEAARQSEDRMRRFVADASHELRTPLTSIRGFAELTRQRGGTADPDTMRRIEDEAKRMGLLVDDLLLLARLDQQRPLQREPVDLLTLAGDAVHYAEAVQPERKVEFRILPGSEAPVVEGDEARLRQVLGNLVSNALHHTPETAPVTISVGTRDGSAVLEVSDTGPGLSPEQKNRVFERFYRADTARTRTTGGSGLGLSIVAALVAAHAGKVTISDTPGGGTTFTVLLPLEPAQA